MSLKEQVAYLKGLSEGLDINTADSKEGKLIASIIDTLTIMADEIESLIENALDIGDELDALSEDLADVEQFVYEDDDDDDFFDYDDYDDDYDDYDDYDDPVDTVDTVEAVDTVDTIDSVDTADEVVENNNEENVESSYEEENSGVKKECDSDCFCDLCSGTELTFDVTCPACNAEIELEESDLSGSGINCPRCNELLEFEFEDEE